jgi:hypothetical protein
MSIENSCSPCKLFKARKDQASTTDFTNMLSFARELNDNCHRSHSCDGLASTFMPTRLVEVQVKDGKYVTKLVEQIPSQKYIALSHCWGKNMKESATTKISTLRENMNNIPWGNLTQTFRDAIAVTESLGYKYIWIDSLCIIQDRKVDWKVESTHMGSVYENCDLMLSADAAPGGSTGLFRSAQISSKPWMSQIRGSIPDIKIAYTKIHRTFGQMIQMFATPDEWAHLCPLDTRAWCFQESRLAPRILHLGIDELHWDCHAEVRCQCGGFGPEGMKFRGDRMRKKDLREGYCTMKDKLLLWKSFVAQYSERFLTYWSDRLPAISGLAKQFLVAKSKPMSMMSLERQDKFDQIYLGEYLAGLWSKDLELSLCWHADYRPRRRLSTLLPQYQYIAPSWSWASVSGPVNWPEDNEFDSVINIISASCTASGGDPMGAVSYGEVVLRGKVIELSAYRGEVTGQDVPRMVYYYDHLECHNPSTGSQTCPGTYRPDTMINIDGYEYFAGANYFIDKPDVQGADLLPLTDGDYYGLLMAKTYIMILRPVLSGESDTFERLGSIWMSGLSSLKSDKSQFFEGVEPRVLKLV